MSTTTFYTHTPGDINNPDPISQPSGQITYSLPVTKMLYLNMLTPEDILIMNYAMATKVLGFYTHYIIDHNSSTILNVAFVKVSPTVEQVHFSFDIIINNVTWHMSFKNAK